MMMTMSAARFTPEDFRRILSKATTSTTSPSTRKKESVVSARIRDVLSKYKCFQVPDEQPPASFHEHGHGGYGQNHHHHYGHPHGACRAAPPGVAAEPRGRVGGGGPPTSSSSCRPPSHHNHHQYPLQHHRNSSASMASSSMRYGGFHGGHHGGWRRSAAAASSSSSSSPSFSMMMSSARPLSSKIKSGTGTSAAAMGLLNKVSTRNFQTIMTSARPSILDGTLPASELVAEAFKKCCTDHGYIKVYALMILEISELSSNHRNLVLDAVLDFARGFLEVECKQRRSTCTFGGVGDGVNPKPEESYDDFCAGVKAKKMLIGKNRAIIELMHAGLLPTLTAGAYVHVMLRALDEDAADLLTLDFIADFVKLFVRADRTNNGYGGEGKDDAWRLELSQTLAAIKDGLSPKHRFKVLDILNDLRPGTAATTACKKTTKW